jgi:hypothetical protein
MEYFLQVIDITVHCLDQAVIKNKGLQEAFPAICRFVLRKTDISFVIMYYKRKKGYIFAFVMGCIAGIPNRC